MRKSGYGAAIQASVTLFSALGLMFGGSAVSAQERLSPYTPVMFQPDGNICEFIHVGSDCQEYFRAELTLPGPNLGAVKAASLLAPGVFVRRDNSPVPGTENAAGPTGFLDPPGVAAANFIPTSFNVGRVFASYNPYAYPTPTGFEGAYFLAMDISAPALLDVVEGTQPIAFDIDGDGSVITQTEINPDAVSEAPLNADKINREGYSIRINTDGIGAHEVSVIIGEQVENIPDGAIEINGPCCSGICEEPTGAGCPAGTVDVNGRCCSGGACAPQVGGTCPAGTSAINGQCCTPAGPRPSGCDVLAPAPGSGYSLSPNSLPPHVINGFCVRRYVLFKDNTNTLPGTDEQQAIRFLDFNDDGFIDWTDFGVGSDVEYVIRDVASLPRNTAPACPRLSFLADSFDDAFLGGGAEDAMILPLHAPVPDLEVIKEARCATEPTSPFTHHVRAVPDSDVEYRITLQNHGNRDLNVSIEDALSCVLPATAQFVPGSCIVDGVRPGGVSADFCQRFESAFNSPDGFPLAVGRLNAADQCAVRLGEQLVFRFRTRLGPPCSNDPACDVFCDDDVDCTNAISASGTIAAAEDFILAPDRESVDSPDGNAEEEDCESAACCAAVPACPTSQTCIEGICTGLTCPPQTCTPVSNGIGDARDEFLLTVFDEAGVADTRRERLTADDNVITIELECRGIDFTKEVRVLPNGSFQTGLTPVDLAPPAPISIEYRYSITNRGEVDESVALNDASLCGVISSIQSAQGAGSVQLLNCGLCGAGGQQTQTVASESTFQTSCVIRFNTDAALRAFTRADDQRPTCRADAMSGLQQLCFRNCATATATATNLNGICQDGPILDGSDSTVCYFPCDIEVTKQTRCLDNCQDKSPIGVSKDTLLTTRDSCIEYVIDVRNSSSDVPLCRLSLTDLLEDQPACVEFDGVAHFSIVPPVGPEVACPVVPSGFNVTGGPFEWDPVVHCGRPALAPGETLRITFNATIPVDAPANCGPFDNSGAAQGAANCRASGPVFACQDSDSTSVDLLEPSLACSSKEWAFQWDSDADCEPELPYSPFAQEIDLRDKVFPARLQLRIRADNTGQVPIEVMADDAALIGCLNTVAGASLCTPGLCELGLPKVLGVGESATWLCEICVATAEAMRDLDACDGAADGVYINHAQVAGRLVRDDTNICVPEEFNVSGAEVNNACRARIRVPGPCDLEVTKQVKCSDDPDAAYAADIDVVAGARLTYRIQVSNVDTLVKLPRVCIDDELSCASWLVPATCTARIQGVDVSGCVCADFIAAVTGGNRDCSTFAACRPAAPWIAPGETLTITFDVRVPDGFNVVGTNPDCTNEVDVEGYSEVCVPTEVQDAACDVDSSEAQLDVLIPDMNCEKSVGPDLNNDGQVDGGDASFTTNLLLPCDTQFPYSLIYRFKLINKGETPLTNVQVCDPMLRADAQAAGLTVGTCFLAGTGEGCGTLALLPPGALAIGLCRLTVPTRAAWEAFARSDGTTDAICYDNTAAGRAQVDTTAICDATANINVASDGCSARACLAPLCSLDVEKSARCVENCQNDNFIGLAKDRLPAAPGSCVQFDVNVTNTHATLPLCRMRIRDTLSGGASNIVFDNDVSFVCGGVSCPVPAGFNVTGAAYEFNPGTCPGLGGSLPAGGLCTISFKARVPENADPTVFPRNDIIVEAAPTCPVGAGSNFCCSDSDSADIDILRPAVECTDKTYSYAWDSDGDCAADEPFTAFNQSVDLRDKVFPVHLRLRVRARNSGEVPLEVTATDSTLACVCGKLGVECNPDDCDLDVPRLLGPGESGEWLCDIRVESAEAMRSVDSCDGQADDQYRNTVAIAGKVVRSTTNSCVPQNIVVRAPMTCFATIQIPGPCDLDVTKDVKCTDDPDSAYADSVVAIPGSTLRYRVRVANTDDMVKLPRVCVRDVLGCRDWLVPNSVAATLGATNVTACTATAMGTALQGGGPECLTFAACRPAAPWLAPGETLTITFDVRVPAGFHSSADPDCLNEVTVDGHSEVCPPLETSGNPCDTDTDTAQIDVSNTSVNCNKEVAADFNRDGTADTPFSGSLTLACNTQFPFGLVYRFTVTNKGETALTNVSVCDEQLRADAAAAGLTLGTCSLPAPPGQCATVANLAPGASVTATCSIVVPSESAWVNFAGRDGDALTSCYINESHAEAQTTSTGLCDAGADRSARSEPCMASVCLLPDCQIAVTKEVRCLDNCTERNPVGDAADPLAVAPGSCVEYVVNVTNTSTTDPLCRLRIRDTLTGQPANVLVQGTPQFRIGNTSCAVPPDFNLAGNAFEFNPQTCTGGPIPPGGTMTFSFTASVPETADPSVTPINAVVVEGAPTCPVAGPDFCCQADGDATLDILRARVSCAKDWSLQWDSNADCQPGPAFIDFTSDLDLRDKVFPVNLRLRVRATNSGEVPLEVTASDSLIACVCSTPGVTCAPQNCALDQIRSVAPGGTGEWLCDIRIDKADAAQALDTCDGNADSTYVNSVTVAAKLVAATTEICVPENRHITGDAVCTARIRLPDECALRVTKTAQCVDQCFRGTTSGSASGSLDNVIPGAFVRFAFTVTNTATLVKAPRVCLTDILDCADWMCDGSVTATLQGQDVTSCLSGFEPDGERACFTFAACRPSAPWLAPNETLTVNFDVQVPPDFNILKESPDCLNSIAAELLTEVCPADAKASCGPERDEAQVDVKLPRLECEKTVSVDLGNDGIMDVSDQTLVNLANPTFPMKLVYKFQARNTGEVPLSQVSLCDAGLVKDAKSAGIRLGSCGFCNPPDCSAGGSCRVVGNVQPGALALTTCELIIEDEAQWDKFADLDRIDDRNDCYTNRAEATGRANPSCAPPNFDSDVSSEACEAKVCVSIIRQCPITKAVFDIWNQNEIRFSGTERCIESWDETLLSRYTFGGIPNHFVRTALQTNRGRARIDGVASSVVCGGSSISAPLLGVATKIMNFGRAGVDTAGTTLVGMGIEAGTIYHTPGSNPNSAALAATENTVKGEVTSAPDLAPLSTFLPTRLRAGESEKGSLIVFPKVEIKWDAEGRLIQDTFVDIANDYPASVQVQLYFVNGDQAVPPVFGGDPPRLMERAHLGCNWVDNVITLTANEPTFWSAATGLPKGVSPLTILDPGTPPGRPDIDPRNVGGRTLRGYILAWAVDSSSQEIRWNHLKGDALIVNYRDASAWEYNAWSFQAVAGATNGSPLLEPLGRLDLDEIEYEAAPDKLLLNFFASGTVLSSVVGQEATIDTDLTLWVATKDLRQP